MFKEAYVDKMGGVEIEGNKFDGQISTFVRMLISKDSDLSSCFDQSIENNIGDTSLKKILTDNHKTQSEKRKQQGICN